MAVPRPRTQIHPVMHPPQTLSPPRLPPVETGRREDAQKGNSYTLKIINMLRDNVSERPHRRTRLSVEKGKHSGKQRKGCKTSRTDIMRDGLMQVHDGLGSIKP